MWFIKRSSFLQKAERYTFFHTCTCIGAPWDEALFTYTVFAWNNALIILILSIHKPTRSLWALFSCSCLNFDFWVWICVLYWDTLHPDSCLGVWMLDLSTNINGTTFPALLSTLLLSRSKADVHFLTLNNTHCCFELHLKDNWSAWILFSLEVHSLAISSTHCVLTVDRDLTEFETAQVFHDNSFIRDPAVKQTH